MPASFRSRIPISLVAAATLLLSPVFARAGSAQEPGLLYGTADMGTKLVAFNLEAGRVRVIGDIGFSTSLPLAFCGPGGAAYTITNIFDPAKAQLATLNLGTGAATLVGSPLGQGLSIMGMTCAPDGTLYAVGQLDDANEDFNSLYTVDRETGLASRVGPTGVPGGFGGFFMALAFAPDGTLYAANINTLFTIDRDTGAASPVVDFVGVTFVMGLAVDMGGNFYVCNWGAEGTIFALDVSTGEATPVLSSGLAFVHNVAFRTPAR
jgi:DNA-binding beta-propeller fold protein YncE